MKAVGSGESPDQRPSAFPGVLDRQGLIIDERRYYDVADQLEQLGLSE
ncbi:hypothetical protein [Georgenia yuyongxinii]|nr:hypothetical protein [Georgenia yuyongxinii]